MKCDNLEIEFSKLMEGNWGCNFRDGWYDLVRNLLIQLQEIAPETKVLQVKEKFGGLRFYVSKANKEVRQIIKEVEDKSYSTCEFTGKLGQLRSVKGWTKTCCDEVYEKAKLRNSWREDDDE